jgi:Rrf2 family protein
MPLTSKTCLALAVLIAIAHHAERGGPIGSQQLEQRYLLARRTLEPVLQRLVRGGFLRSLRGARGGYFVEAPDRLTLGQVLRVLEPELLGRQPLNIFQAVLDDAFAEAHASLLERLEEVTIADMANRAAARGIGRDLEPLVDYSI